MRDLMAQLGVDDGPLASNTSESGVRLHELREANVAFNEKLQELVAQHGAPGTADVPNSADLSYVTGLAYAELVD